MDEQGMRPDALRKMLAEWDDIERGHKRYVCLSNLVWQPLVEASVRHRGPTVPSKCPCAFSYDNAPYARFANLPCCTADRRHGLGCFT